MVKPGNWHLAFDRIKKKPAEPNNSGQGPTFPAQDAKNAAAKPIQNSPVVPLRETESISAESAADESNIKKQTLTRKAIGAIGLLHKAKSYAEELAKLQAAAEVEVQSSEDKIAQVESALQAEKHARTTAEANVRVYTLKFNQFQEEVKAHQKGRETAQQQSAALTKENAELQEKIKKLSSSLDELKNKILAETQARKEAQEQARAENEIKKQLAAQLERQAKDHSEELSQAQTAAQKREKEFAKEIGKWQTDAKKLSDETAQVRCELKIAQDAISQADKEIKLSASKMATLESVLENEKLARNTAEENVTNYAQQLVNLHAEIEVQRKTAEAAQKQVDSLTREKFEAKEKIGHLSKALEDTDAKLHAETDSNKQLNEKIERLLQETNVAAEKIINLDSALKKQEKTYSQETANLKIMLQSERGARTAAEEKINIYSKQLTQLQSELKNEKEARYALFEQLEAAGQEKAAADEKTKIHEQQISQLKENSNKQDIYAKGLAKQVEMISLEKAAADEKLQIYSQQAAEFKKRLDNESQRADSLLKQFESAEQEKTAANEKVQLYCQQALQLNAQLENEKQRTAGLLKQIEAASQEKLQSDEKINHYSKQINGLQLTLENEAAAKEKLLSRLDMEMQAKLQLANEIQELTKAHSETIEKIQIDVEHAHDEIKTRDAKIFEISGRLEQIEHAKLDAENQVIEFKDKLMRIEAELRFEKQARITAEEKTKALSEQINGLEEAIKENGSKLQEQTDELTAEKAKALAEKEFFEKALEEAQTRLEAELQSKQDLCLKLEEQAKIHSQELSDIRAAAEREATQQAQQLANVCAELKATEQKIAAADEQVKDYTEDLITDQNGILEKPAVNLETHIKIEEKLNQLNQQTENSTVLQEQSGACDCCDKAGIPAKELIKIASGQNLCTDCFTQFK